jgi:hypothetical protein
MKKILISFLIGIILAAGFFAWLSWFRGAKKPSTYVNLDRAAVIKEMRELQRLETASFTIEKIIDAGSNQGNKLKEILFGDKLLLVAQGEVIAGFDLSQMNENDINVEEGKFSITLPKPQILFTKLNNNQTRVYDRKTGILSKGEKDLESEAREQAELSIRAAACEANILTQASDNARKQLTALFNTLGYKEVTIVIPSAECK